MVEEVQTSLNIAFASSNQTYLDEHLGSCQHLVIYQITTKNNRLISSVQLTNCEGHNQQKIQDRLTALEGCFAVYCLACGNPVRQQLLKQGIRVIIRPEKELIISAISKLQTHWPGTIANRQQRQIAKKTNVDYLSKLADSEW